MVQVKAVNALQEEVVAEDVVRPFATEPDRSFTIETAEIEAPPM